MSLFGAMSTAISGLSAQSAAFSNISDNVANSQTVGFKRTDTSFEDYLTSSSSTQNDSGTVAARPDYMNSVQGAITGSDNPLAMAISGQGFFTVGRLPATTNAAALANAKQGAGQQLLYTRDGNFSMNASGYLVNDSGDVLYGWLANASGAVNESTPPAAVQVTQMVLPPQPTTTVALSANLPASPAAGNTISSQVDVYDATGTAHPLQLDWAQTAPGNWTLNVSSSGTALGTATVQFNAAGVLSSVSPSPLSVTPGFATGPITINLGTPGQTDGVTQFAGTDYKMNGVTQDGQPPGSLTGLSVSQGGDVTANYDNGQSRLVAHIPIATFTNPDALQRQDGQAFSSTAASGPVAIQDAGSGAAGTLVTSSVEGSNVDIGTEFSKLIVAQQAYSANTKMVTTADQMLQQTINMKQ